MISDRFEIELLEEAREFVQNIDAKARYKLLFNIDKSKKFNDPKVFKKLDNDIWGSDLNLKSYNTDSWLSGTKETTKTLSWFVLMDL